MEIAYLPSDDLREVREEIERFKPKLVLCDANVFLDAISQSPATVARKRQKVGEPPLAEAVPSISNQEKKILSMLAKGLKNDEIAQVLRVSARTVKRVLSNLFERLDVTNRTELIGRASELSLLEDDE